MLIILFIAYWELEVVIPEIFKKSKGWKHITIIVSQTYTRLSKHVIQEVQYFCLSYNIISLIKQAFALHIIPILKRICTSGNCLPSPECDQNEKKIEA